MSCRNTPPHSPPSTYPSEYTSGALEKFSAARNHAKPSRTISAPVRLSGRRRHAYSPTPMKLQATAGPKTAHTVFAFWWSLASTSATTPAPHSQCREDDGTRARGAHAADGARLTRTARR